MTDVKLGHVLLNVCPTRSDVLFTWLSSVRKSEPASCSRVAKFRNAERNLALLRQEFAKFASTRDGESRKITGNVAATANSPAKMLRTSRTSEIDQACLSHGLNYRIFLNPAEWIHGDSFLMVIDK